MKRPVSDHQYEDFSTERVVVLPAAGAIYGASLLLAPKPILSRVPGLQLVDHRAVVAARIAGARHLIQSGLMLRRHTRGWMLGAATVEVTHAATMTVLAVARPDRRRLALLSAGVAAVSAVVYLEKAASAPTSSVRISLDGQNGVVRR